MKNAKVLIALTVVAALVGCNKGGGSSSPTTTKVAKEAEPAAKIVEGMDTNLFPVKVGNQWTYSVAQTLASNGQVRNGTMEVTFRVKSVDRTPEGVKATLEVSNGTKLGDRQLWLINKDGIFQIAVGMKLVPFSTPQPVLRFPIKDGNTFRWEGTGVGPTGKTRSYSVKATLHSEQPVDTDLKQFRAVSLESRSTITEGSLKGQEQTTTWFTPGVGIVRLFTATAAGKAQSRNLLKLKSYSLK